MRHPNVLDGSAPGSPTRNIAKNMNTAKKTRIAKKQKTAKKTKTARTAKAAKKASRRRDADGTRHRLSATEAFVTSALRAVLQLVHQVHEASGAFPRRPMVLRYLRGYARGAVLPTVLDAVPEFGVFCGLPNAWVARLIDGLVEEGYLELDLDGDDRCSEAERPDRLRLGERGRIALKRPASLEAAPFIPTPESAALERLRATDTEAAAVEEALVRLRARLARSEGRPAFSVLPNDVVAVLVRVRPADLGELASVRGMGAERVRKYGRKILGALRKAKA